MIPDGIRSAVRERLFNAFYNTWPRPEGELADGYTIIAPIPADLPVFLFLTLEVLKHQDLKEVGEILVVPDEPSAEFETLCRSLIAETRGLPPVRFKPLRSQDKLMLRLSGTPNFRHFMQLVNGVSASRTRYATLHDADLFLPAGDFLHQNFAACRDGGLSVFGIERRSTQSRDGRDIAATWEVTFDVEWARSFPPKAHKGQRAEYGGRVQEFDTMIYPQYLSAPEVVGLAENMPPYYHFRHVISSWRDLKNGHPTPLNGGLKLFLIRTLVDVFDHSGWDYDPLPEHKAFVDGTVDYSRMMSDEEADEMVRFFFAEFNGLIDAHIFDEAQNRELRRRVSELRAVLCEL